MSKEEKYYCARCGADLTKKPFTCYASEIDRKLICLDCFQKEQPKYLANKISDLEAKLAESEENCEEFKQVISKCTGELPPNVAFDIANDDIRYQIICNLTDRNQEHRKTIRELKQQLAEQKRVCDWLDNVLKEYAKQEELLSKKLKSLGVDCIEDLGKTHNQDKISFCIEQLEKARDDIKNISIDHSGYDEFDFQETTRDVCVTIIDNQIEELKKESNNG